MAITLSQSVLGVAGYPPTPAAFVSPVPVGDVIVCAICSVGTGTLGTISVADSVNSGSYIQLANYQDATNGSTAALFYIVANTLGTPTITATCGTVEYSQICIADFTGFTGTVTVDAGAATIAGGNSATPTDSPVTNAQANELLLCAASVNYGWTIAPPVWTGASTTQIGLYYALIASASQNTPFSGTFGTAAIWDVATAGLYGKAASSGGGANILLLGV